MLQRKKILIILLIILTIGLGGIAAYISINIANNQSPTDTGAATICPAGYYPGQCGGYVQEFGSDGTACSSTERVCYPSGSDAYGECFADSSCSCIAASRKCSGTSPCFCGPSFDAVCQSSPSCQESQGWCSTISCVPKSGGTSTPVPTANPTCGPAGCDGDTRPQCFPYVPGSSQLLIQNSDCSVKRTGDSCTQKNGSGVSTGITGTCQNAPSCSCVAAALTPTTTPTLSPTNTPTSTPIITSTPTVQPTSTLTITPTTSQSPTPTSTSIPTTTNTPTANNSAAGAGLPDTGVFDDARFLLIGMALLVIAYVTYRLKIGREFSGKLVGNVSGKINEIKDGKPFMPFEESTIAALDRKRKKKKFRIVVD